MCIWVRSAGVADVTGAGNGLTLDPTTDILVLSTSDADPLRSGPGNAGRLELLQCAVF